MPLGTIFAISTDYVVQGIRLILFQEVIFVELESLCKRLVGSADHFEQSIGKLNQKRWFKCPNVYRHSVFVPDLSVV